MASTTSGRRRLPRPVRTRSLSPNPLAGLRSGVDDSNLVSHADLVPVAALAERTGLPELLERHVRSDRKYVVNAAVKVGSSRA
jgi:hypothetical protein